MKNSCIILAFCMAMTACQKNTNSAITQLPKNKNIASYSGPSTPVALPDFLIGGYLPYWGIGTYQAYAYEHINMLYLITTISQKTVTEEKGLIWGDNDASPTAYQQPPLADILSFVRSKNPDIRIVLALSDLHNNDVQRAATATLFNNTNRAQTIQYLMRAYVDSFQLDGIDIDFEDSSLDPGFIGANYPLFIRDLATALHDSTARGRRKICTVSLAIGDHSRSNINQDVYQNADLLGIQDYGREKMDYLQAEPNRNLATVSDTWAQKVSKNKLAFGIGLWSQYANTSGTGAGDGMSYEALLKLQPADTTFTPYLTTYFNAPGKPSGYVQRYNSLYETRRKAEYLKAHQFRGLFTWDITKDAVDSNYRRYSLLKLLHEWNTNPLQYKPITGFTRQDYYSSSQSIVGGFHSLTASSTNWVGIYELNTGNSIGYYQYLANSSSGSFTIPASVVQTLTTNKLYILRFYNGAGGIGLTFLGTSHPFYKI
ncbi:glycoside hydrolase family 18 protein [Chitinophaga arvensicola]|uniref:Glycosyl hydrolases family 18 n=1 Tax=Chitinophaga arvensicola TaxID=29529 RepID=A0A1I0RH06_9BACT|nr:glycoside hydrolase family 18 protein [Chitinophaga arvensicola]SEW40183.1 Glycosyl hydrolases family 18 [Chitinophaga arvensicola]